MASDDETEGSDPSRRSSTASISDSYEYIDSEGTSGHISDYGHSARRRNAVSPSELRIYDVSKPTHNAPPSARERRLNAMDSPPPRRQFTTSTAGSADDDGWENIPGSQFLDALRSTNRDSLSDARTSNEEARGNDGDDGYMTDDETYFDVEGKSSNPEHKSPSWRVLWKRLLQSLDSLR
jgi:hypothetical protein